MKRFVSAADNGGWTTYDVSTNVIPIIDVDAYGGTLSAFFYDTDSVIPEDSLDDFWNQVVNESMDIIQDCFNEYYIPAEVVPGYMYPVRPCSGLHLPGPAVPVHRALWKLHGSRL